MKIEARHFEYLVVQRGEVSDARHDFAVWQAAFVESIRAIYANIAPVLPATCARCIDIGSGLGAIDCLVAAHYTPQPVMVLIDGKDDPPVVRWHNHTFSNMEVALDFQKKNGTKYACYFPPNEWPNPEVGKADLVISFAAYAFHILPSDYISEIKRSIHDKTVLIFDVRQTRKEWLKELVEAFGVPKVIHRGKKHVRCAFRA